MKFVRDKAKTLNDPSFAPLLSTSSPSYSKPERLNKSNFKSAVSVRKTEITAPTNTHDNNNNIKVADPDKQCPLHNKPHSLRKCHGFRAKTLDERKSFLKENKICYKCCSSVDHMARDCDTSIQCYECKSNHHVAALHPGPAPWKPQAPASTAPEEHGGEQLEAIVSKCTDMWKR